MIAFKMLGIYNQFLQYLGKKGVFQDTAFPDVVTHFPQAKILEQSHAIIRDEYLQYLQLSLPCLTLKELGLYGGNNASTLPWNRVNSDQEEDPDWTTLFLKANKKIIHRNAQYFPNTVALLGSMPNVVNVFISRLGPHAKIKPHYGYMKGFLRYHLGIITPDCKRCYLEVNGDRYYWKPGESVVFDDMFLHAAYNESDQARVILYIDFYRPLPYFYGWINRQIVSILMNHKIIKKAEDIINNF